MTPIEPCKHKFNPRFHFKSMLNYIINHQDYIESNRAASGNKSVFRICPGHSVVIVTDFVAAQAVLDAPLDMISRVHDRRRLNLVAPKAMIKGTYPPLIARNETHKASRGLLDEIYRTRAPQLEDNLKKVFDQMVEQIPKNDLSPLRENIVYFGQKWAFEWLFETSPCRDDLILLDANFGQVNTDSRLVNLFLPNSSKKANQCIERAATLIRESVHFPLYQKLANKHGLPLKELEYNLLTTLVINSGLVTSFALFPAIVQMHKNPDVLQRLKEEQQHRPYQFFKPDTDSYLNCIFRECLRLHPVKQLTRMTEVDIQIPSATGEIFEIPKGEEILVSMPFVHRDPTIWEDPETFDPSRFERNPELDDKLIFFGKTKNSTAPYGCAGAYGLSEHVFKYFFTRFVCDYDWDFLQKPTVSLNSFIYAAPRDLMLTHFVTQQEAQEQKATEDISQGSLAKQNNLAKQFSDACELKNQLLGELSRDEIQCLYGLYKQALYGDCDPRPPKEIQINRKIIMLKHQAWLSQSGKSKEQAYQDYVDKVNEVLTRSVRRNPLPLSMNKPAQTPASSNENDQLNDGEFTIYSEEELFLSSVFEKIYGDQEFTDEQILDTHHDVIHAQSSFAPMPSHNNKNTSEKTEEYS